MMKKTPIILLCMLCMVLAVPAAATSIALHVEPNTTTTEKNLFVGDVTNLLTYWDYTDGKLNLLQDWWGNTSYFTTVNTTFIPPSFAHWTFDYDNESGAGLSDWGGMGGDHRGNRFKMWRQDHVGYWSFEEHSPTTIFDWADTNNIGTRGGGSLNHTDGHKGAYYVFDGVDDRVVMADDSSLRLITGGTITAWIKPDSIGENSAGRIVDKAQNDVGANGYSFHIGGDNTLRFIVNGGALTFSTNNAITLGAWQHVAVVFDNTGRALYVNGVDVTSGGGGEVGLPPDVADSVAIGNREAGWERTFDGAIDEVYIYNRTLKPSEVQNHANDGCINKGYCYTWTNGNTEAALWIPHNFTMRMQTATLNYWLKAFHPEGRRQGGLGMDIGGFFGSVLGYTMSLNGSRMTAIIGKAGSHDETFTELTDNEWHMWTMVFNSTKLAIFKDGVLMNETANTITTIDYSFSPQFWIGDAGGSSWNGSIDDVTLWNHSFSPAQVLEVYNSNPNRSVAFNLSNIANGTYRSTISYHSLNGTFLNATSNFTRVFDKNYSTNFLNIDECIDSNIESLGIRIRHEDVVDAPLIASVDLAAVMWYTDAFNGPKFNKTVGINVTGASEYTFCIFQNKTLNLDLFIRYTTAGGFTHRFFFVNQTLNQTVQNVSLFNFNFTTGISDFDGTVRKEGDFSIFENVVTSLQRLYIEEGNLWRTIQMDESGEFGKIFFNIREADTDYRMRFMRRSDQAIIRTTDRLKFVCDTSVCSFTITLPDTPEGTAITDLMINLTHNTARNDIDLEWDDPTGITQTVTLVVTKETLGGTISICDITQTGSAGFMNCSITGFQGNILARVFASASPDTPQSVSLFFINTTQLWDIIREEGLSAEASFWSFGILVTMTVGTALASPVAAIAMMSFGTIILSFFGLLPVFSVQAIILLIVMSLIIVVAITKRFSG